MSFIDDYVDDYWWSCGWLVIHDYSCLLIDFVDFVDVWGSKTGNPKIISLFIIQSWKTSGEKGFLCPLIVWQASSLFSEEWLKFTLNIKFLFWLSWNLNHWVEITPSSLSSHYLTTISPWFSYHIPNVLSHVDIHVEHLLQGVCEVDVYLPFLLSQKN